MVNQKIMKEIDLGGKPYVVNVPHRVQKTSEYQAAIWTGSYLQFSAMCLPPGEYIELTSHPETDVYLRIEHGSGYLQMGASCDHLNHSCHVCMGDAIFIPAGVWYQLSNMSSMPLDLTFLSAPTLTPKGVNYPTKEDRNAE
jgi:mannose-6-phosphate isomerase-like protein (cupin superfamily)